MFTKRAVVVVVAALWLSCGSTLPEEIDAGVCVDAGIRDAGITVDAGIPPEDAGIHDAGFDVDAGIHDAGIEPFCAVDTCLSPAGETCWSCWSGRPDAGEDVTVPAGLALLLDESANVGAMTINGSVRVAPTPITLEATGITVFAGTFTAGSEAMPREQPLRISLRGTTREIAVQNRGRFDLYGAAPFPLFTTAASTLSGSTVTLAEPTTWRAGDEVLVTPTGHYATTMPFSSIDGGRASTEYFTVTSSSGAQLVLNEALQFDREGVLDAGAPLDLRAEVANLTRPIVIEGANDADWANGVGAHVVVSFESTAHLEGVRLERVGNRETVAPPIEFSMVNNTTERASFSRSVIVDSASRGVVLWLSHGVSVTNNVLARITGHGLLLKTGTERKNVIARNLVTDLREPSPHPFRNSEISQLTVSPLNGAACGSSGFVITNPDNVTSGNVASDLPGCGFWLAFAPRGRNLIMGIDLSPRLVPFGVFENNTAHSIGGQGVNLGTAIIGSENGETFVDVEYHPQADTTLNAAVDYTSTLGATLTNTRVFGTQHNAFHVTASKVTLSRATVWSPGAFIMNNRASLLIDDSVFVGRLGNLAQPSTSVTGFFLNGPKKLSGARTRFVNLPAHPTLRSGGLVNASGANALGFDETLNFTDTTFTNVDYGVRAPRPTTAAFDICGPILVDATAAQWWVDDLPYFSQGRTCVPSPRANTTSGLLCTGANYMGVSNLRVTTAGGVDLVTEAEVSRLVTGNPHVGLQSSPGTFVTDVSRALPLVIGETATLRFPAYMTTPRGVRLRPGGPPGASSVVRLAYPATTTFSVEAVHDVPGSPSTQPVTFTSVSSLSQLESSDGTRFYFDGAFLYLKLLSDFRNGSLSYGYSVRITASGAGIP